MKRGQLESHLLVLVTLALVAFGLVMVYSATSAAAAVDNGDPAYYVKRQGIFALLGIVAMIVASRFDHARLRGLAPTFVAVSVLLLLAVLVAGQRVNGARRWFTLGPLSIQPSELMKVSLAIWLAAHLARRPAPRTLGELHKPIGLLVTVCCALLLAEPDLGTAVAVGILLGGVLIVSGAPAGLMARAGLIAAGAAMLAIYLEPYRRGRIFAFLHPWNDSQGAGYQTVQAMIGLGSGGPFGRGLGQSVTKIFYLPEAHTDMIFAIIGEELGLVGSFAVVAAYTVFAYAGLRIALGCRDPFGKRLAAGVTVLVCGQAALNLAAVMGIAPLTGIPLPLVSYGGSSIVVVLASVGILLNIARSDEVEARAQMPDRGRGDRRPRAAVARGSGGAEGARRARDVRRVAGSHRGSARP